MAVLSTPEGESAARDVRENSPAALSSAVTSPTPDADRGRGWDEENDPNQVGSGWGDPHQWARAPTPGSWDNGNDHMDSDNESIDGIPMAKLYDDVVAELLRRATPGQDTGSDNDSNALSDDDFFEQMLHAPVYLEFILRVKACTTPGCSRNEPCNACRRADGAYLPSTFWHILSDSNINQHLAHYLRVRDQLPPYQDSLPDNMSPPVLVFGPPASNNAAPTPPPPSPDTANVAGNSPPPSPRTRWLQMQNNEAFSHVHTTWSDFDAMLERTRASTDEWRATVENSIRRYEDMVDEIARRPITQPSPLAQMYAALTNIAQSASASLRTEDDDEDDDDDMPELKDLTDSSPEPSDVGDAAVGAPETD